MGDHAGQPGSAPGSLADRQAGLVAALTSAQPVPNGFDPRLVEVARVALLRKRAGEVAKQWPLLAAGHAAQWTQVFTQWADARPTSGSLIDGWDLARELAGCGALPALAAEELAVREATFRYDGSSPPRPRRGLSFHRTGTVVALQVLGTVRVLRLLPSGNGSRAG